MLVWVGGGVSSGLEVVLLVGFRVKKKIGNARVSSPLPISRVLFGLSWVGHVMCV
jgi:hypothetical protein